MDVETYLERKRALRDELENNAKALLDHLIGSFLLENPKVQMIRWTQYTPGFNDGEPCVFGIGEVSMLVEGVNEEAKSEEDDFDWYEAGCGNVQWPIQKYLLESNCGYETLTKRDATNMNAFYEAFNDLEDELEYYFGNDKEVQCYVSDGEVKIDVEDYDCGY